jgi:PhzF family phenazine biosynthesis protein
MDFAGHPTLGTAHVVHALHSLPGTFRLELNVGLIDVRGEGDRWAFTSAPATVRDNTHSREALAHLLSLPADALVATPRWVSCGIEHLVIPLRSVADVHAVNPVPSELFSLGRNAQGHVSTYVFAREGGTITSRFFWEQHGVMREDPGTGSACANLGAFLDVERVPAGRLRIEQGHATGRLNVLSLERDGAGVVQVGGRVLPLMRGTLEL